MNRLLIILTFILAMSQPTTGLATDRTRLDSIVEKYNGKSIIELARLGYRSLEQGDYNHAMEIYAAIYPKGNPELNGKELREYVKVLNNIGYIYLFDRHLPEKAYPFLLNARRLAEENRQTDLLGAILDNIAKVYDDFGDTEKALDTYNLAMSHAASVSTDVSPAIQLMVLNDMTNCAMAHNMVNKISPSLKIFDSLPEYPLPMAKYSKTMCRGLRLLISGDTASASSIIGEAVNLIDCKLDAPRYKTDHYLTMGNLYHIRNIEDSACVMLGLALQTAESHNLYDRLPRIYRGMATVEAACGDSSQSREMLLLAYEADERLHSSKIYASLKTLEASQEIDSLTMKLAEADIRHSHRVTIIWILAIGLSIIAIMLTYIFFRNRRLASSLRELVKKHQSSIQTEEANARLCHEYECAIASLRKELEECRDKITAYPNDKTPPKRLTLPVGEEERLRIIGTVKDILNTSEEIFQPDFSLERLAELTDTKPRYLSALINETMGKSFSTLLGEARVKKACRLLLSPDFRSNKTIESIATEVGYKSRTHFSSIFKKITGVTPLQYASISR